MGLQYSLDNVGKSVPLVVVSKTKLGHGLSHALEAVVACGVVALDLLANQGRSKRFGATSQVFGVVRPVEYLGGKFRQRGESLFAGPDGVHRGAGCVVVI